MKMNFIIRNNNDSDGITENIISEIKKKYEVGYGAVIECGKIDRKRADNIEYISSDLIWDSDCLGLHFEKIKSVPRDILNEMVWYKDKALHMVSRESHYDIYEYKYCEDLYYKFLFFWYKFLNEHSINHIIFMIAPHHTGEYILYSLAKVMNIRVLIMFPTISAGLYFVGSSVEGCGRLTEREFKELPNINYSIPKGWWEDFYNKALNNQNTFSDKEIKKLKREAEKIICHFSSISGISFFLLRFGAIIIKRKYRGNKKFFLKQNYRKFRYAIKARFRNATMDHLKEYKRLSVEPDYDSKFIYFALQQTPEETTLPRAGEFRNQLLSIQMLNESVDGMGIKIYVKEHWVQPRREKGFYKELSSLRNVELINLNSSSSQLIRKSVAVATQTGTCVLEAAINGVNSFYFGEGCAFKGIPGSVIGISQNQIRDELNAILCGNRIINHNEVIKYIVAMKNSTILSYCDSIEEVINGYDKEKTSSQIVELLDEDF